MIPLQSKHVVMDAETYGIVQEVLDTCKPNQSGRESFIIRRVILEPSTIQHTFIFPSYSFEVRCRHRNEEEVNEIEPSGKTGSKPAPVQDLLKLDEAVHPTVKDVEIDLFCFLTGTESVQMNSPELWLDYWRLVAEENPSIVQMCCRSSSSSGPRRATRSWEFCSRRSSATRVGVSPSRKQ